jgi:hypothetical protein
VPENSGCRDFKEEKRVIISKCLFCGVIGNQLMKLYCLPLIIVINFLVVYGRTGSNIPFA